MESKANASKKSNPQTILKEAKKHIDGNQLGEALVKLIFAIKEHPHNADLLIYRSRILLKMGQFYEALEDVKQALRIDPVRDDIYELRGDIEFGAQHFQAALKSYKMARKFTREKTSSIQEKIQLCVKEKQKGQKRKLRGLILSLVLGLTLGCGLVLSDFLPVSPAGNRKLFDYIILILAWLIPIAFCVGLQQFQVWATDFQIKQLLEAADINLNMPDES